MSLPKKIISFTLLLAISSCFAVDNHQVGDPIKIPMQVSPSSIQSSHSGMMNISALHYSISYNVQCSLTTNQNNDPFYVVGAYGPDPINWEIDYKMTTIVPTSGVHVLTMSVLRDQNNPASSTRLINASTDTISITNCVATP